MSYTRDTQEILRDREELYEDYKSGEVSEDEFFEDYQLIMKELEKSKADVHRPNQV